LKFFREYGFEIKHIKGKENKVVDALNIRVHEVNATTISMCRKDLKDIILEVVTTYPHYAQAK
jgi:hypothetical protein